MVIISVTVVVGAVSLGLIAFFIIAGVRIYKRVRKARPILKGIKIYTYSIFSNSKKNQIMSSAFNIGTGQVKYVIALVMCVCEGLMQLVFDK